MLLVRVAFHALHDHISREMIQKRDEIIRLRDGMKRSIDPDRDLMWLNRCLGAEAALSVIALSIDEVDAATRLDALIRSALTMDPKDYTEGFRQAIRGMLAHIAYEQVPKLLPKRVEARRTALRVGAGG